MLANEMGMVDGSNQGQSRPAMHCMAPARYAKRGAVRERLRRQDLNADAQKSFHTYTTPLASNDNKCGAFPVARTNPPWVARSLDKGLLGAAATYLDSA